MHFEEVQSIITSSSLVEGDKAHSEMLGRDVLSRKDALIKAKSPRESAVLALIYPIQNAPHIVLIERPEYQGVHSKQIAFPGGAREPEDKTLEETALREAKEEVGVIPSDVLISKPLSPVYIPPSNFIVHPFIAFTPNRPRFTPQESEVAKIIEYPIEHLLDLSNRKRVTVTAGLQNTRIKTNAFVFSEHVIWGATGMMLNELRILITRK